MAELKFITIWLICIIFTVGLLGGSKSNNEKGEKYTVYNPPSIEPGEEGWEIYKNAPLYDKKSAKGVRPGNSSPEAAVVHFYTSMIRGDKSYQEVIPASSLQSSELKDGLETYSEWKFLQFKLVARKKLEDTKFWIKIFFKISFGEGKEDEGEDEVEVEFIEGKWYVTSIPS